MRRFALYVLSTCVITAVLYQRDAATQINTVKELAPGVYFHEGDLRGKGHCNNGWVIFDDYVLVVDANFPSGAQEIIPEDQGADEQTDPLRVRYTPPRRSLIRQPGLGGQWRRSGCARKRGVGDAQV